jgi:hypothetical protein
VELDAGARGPVAEGQHDGDHEPDRGADEEDRPRGERSESQ